VGRAVSDSFSSSPPSTQWIEVLDALPFPVHFREVTDQIRFHLVDRAMRKANHHQQRAAQLLGLRYDQFRTLDRRFQNSTP